MTAEQRYRAFISYSHADEAWGRWLHRRLERYPIPRALVGQETTAGVVPRRLFPIFRDREELPTAAELGSVIETALQRSDFLIVICSPRSAQSQWVEAEIKRFKQLGKADRVLALIVDGEPNAGDKPGDQAECFPTALRFVVDTDGAVTDEACEPIAADARDGKDGRTDAFLKLAAGLLGVGYDQLKRRDQKRRQQRVAIIVTLAAVLTLVFAIISVVALQARSEAVHERDRADVMRREAEEQRDIATEALAKADHEFRRAEQETRKSLRTLTSLLENKAAEIMADGHGRERQTAGLYLAKALTTEPDEQRRQQVHAPRLQSWRLANPAPEAIVQFPSRVETWLPSVDGERVAVVEDTGTLTILDGQTLRAVAPAIDLTPLIRSPEGVEQVVQLYWEPDHAAVWTVEGDGRLRRWPIGGATPSHVITGTLPGGLSRKAFVLTDGVVGITYAGSKQDTPHAVRWRLSATGAEVVYDRSIPGNVGSAPDHLYQDDQWLVGEFDNYRNDRYDTWGICHLVDGSFQALAEPPERLLAVDAASGRLVGLDDKDQVFVWTVHKNTVTKTSIPAPDDDETVTAACFDADGRLVLLDRDWLHLMDGVTPAASYRLRLYSHLTQLWQIDPQSFIAYGKQRNNLHRLHLPLSTSMAIDTIPVSIGHSVHEGIVFRGSAMFFKDFDRVLRRFQTLPMMPTSCQAWPHTISAMSPSNLAIVHHDGPDLYSATPTGLKRFQPANGRDITRFAHDLDRLAVVTPDHRIHVAGWPAPPANPDLHRSIREPRPFTSLWAGPQATVPIHQRYGLACVQHERTCVAVARDLATGAELWRSSPLPNWIRMLTSNADGTMVAGITKDEQTTVHRWLVNNTGTGDLAPVTVPHDVEALCFHDDTLIVCTGESVHYLTDEHRTRPMPAGLQIRDGILGSQPIATRTATHLWVLVDNALGVHAIPTEPDGTGITIRVKALAERNTNLEYVDQAMSAVNVLVNGDVLIGTRDGRVCRADTTGTILWTTNIPGSSARPPAVRSLVPMPDAQTVAVVAQRPALTVTILNLTDGQILHPPLPIPGVIRSITATKEGLRATTSYDQPAPQHLPVITGHFEISTDPWGITLPTAGHCSPITDMAWFDDQLLTIDAHRWIRRHRFHEGHLQAATAAPPDDRLSYRIIRPDLILGLRQVTSRWNSNDGTDQPAQLTSYRFTDRLEPIADVIIDHQPAWMQEIDESTTIDVVPHPDGDRAVVLNGNGALQALTLPGLVPCSPWHYHRPGSGYSAKLVKGALSPAGNLLVTTTGTNTYRVWDISTGLEPASDTLPLPDDSYEALKLSPDGTYLVVLTHTIVWVIETTTGQVIGQAPVANLPESSAQNIFWPSSGPLSVVSRAGLISLDWWTDLLDSEALTDHPGKVTDQYLNDSLQPIELSIPGPNPIER